MTGGFTLGGDDSVYINHNGLVRETPDAKCFWIRGKKMWIPAVNITTHDRKIVAIKKWWADKNHLYGDW